MSNIQLLCFVSLKFPLLDEVEGKGLMSELKNRAGPPALKAGFKNLFGPPSIESNAILPESLSSLRSSSFWTSEVFSSLSITDLRLTTVDHFPVKRKERKVVISCQKLYLKMFKMFKISNV